MNLLIVFIIVVLQLIAIACCASVTSSNFSQSETYPTTQPQNRTQLLVISFDGFRWDYINTYDTPTFDAIARRGVHAKYGIKSAFVTKTFPAHWTIVTGLYEESHGIVGNTFYDPVFNETFIKSKASTQSKWWSGEPIWITARRHGRRAGVYFWPGSEFPVKGMQANEWRRYNKSVPLTDRMDTIVDWLSDPVEPLDLALLYYHEPDTSGHEKGAFSPEVKTQVRFLDRELGNFLNRLNETGVLERLNVIITSDHGMVNRQLDEPFISLGTYVNLEEEVRMIPQQGTLASIMTKPGRREQVYEKLVSAHPNLTVYLKENIPDRFHYRHNRRIMPIIALADEGYLVVPRAGTKAERTWDIGNHGYDNESPSMRPIFFGMGPDFKQNVKDSSIFENVHLYELMCHLLAVPPARNNGTIEATRHLLNKKSQKRIKGSSSSAAGAGRYLVRWDQLVGNGCILAISILYYRKGRHFAF